MCLWACPTLCDPMDSSPSVSFVHGVIPARILEWFTISSSRSSSCFLQLLHWQVNPLPLYQLGNPYIYSISQECDPIFNFQQGQPLNIASLQILGGYNYLHSHFKYIFKVSSSRKRRMTFLLGSCCLSIIFMMLTFSI